MDVEKLEHLGITGGKVKRVTAMENSTVVPQNIKRKITI